MALVSGKILLPLLPPKSFCSAPLAMRAGTNLALVKIHASRLKAFFE
jgi:hypothetical protein